MAFIRVPKGRRHQASDVGAFLALDVEHTRGGVFAAVLPHPRDGVAESRSCTAVT